MGINLIFNEYFINQCVGASEDIYNCDFFPLNQIITCYVK